MGNEVRAALQALRQRFVPLKASLKVDERAARWKALETEMARQGFWENPEKAQKTVAELKAVKATVQPFQEIERSLDDAQALLDLADEAQDASAEAEAANEVERIRGRVDRLELEQLLAGPNDHRNAYLAIQAGTGGVDACDWAQMLLRLYTRWAERRGYGVEVVDANAAEEAGIRSATLHVQGPHAYGYLALESGVHRLVRISPFDAQSRRHTAFASVDVLPEFDEEIEVDVNPADLQVDTFRSGGAGGQHVNKVSSAVRITHLPTGIIVKCQNERSQHANRKTAMALLKARLFRLEESKREATLKQHYNEKGEIAWGNQIRSYVLQPYTLVKDHRTEVETSGVDAVLDGEIDAFIEALLKQRAAQRN